MRIVTATLLVPLALITVGATQKKMKPWTEWSKKEAEKVLNDSPWGQTQVVTDTSEITYTPTSGNSRRSNEAGRAERGAVNQEVYVRYRIRFLSARPIRQGLARMVEIEQKTADPQLSDQLRGFVERSFDDYIVVAVTFESNDQRFAGPVMQDINSAVANMLKNNTYLELSDGKRLFLMDYRAPINDGLGAKFVFPRKVDGKPFITPDGGDVRFFTEVGATVKLNQRFKISDMMYEGKLEF
jgi:hypothetical protein